MSLVNVGTFADTDVRMIRADQIVKNLINCYTPAVGSLVSLAESAARLEDEAIWKERVKMCLKPTTMTLSGVFDDSRDLNVSADGPIDLSAQVLRMLRS